MGTCEAITRIIKLELSLLCYVLNNILIMVTTTVIKTRFFVYASGRLAYFFLLWPLLATSVSLATPTVSIVQPTQITDLSDLLGLRLTLQDSSWSETRLIGDEVAHHRQLSEELDQPTIRLILSQTHQLLEPYKDVMQEFWDLTQQHATGIQTNLSTYIITQFMQRRMGLSSAESSMIYRAVLKGYADGGSERGHHLAQLEFASVIHNHLILDLNSLAHQVDEFLKIKEYQKSERSSIPLDPSRQFALDLWNILQNKPEHPVVALLMPMLEQSDGVEQLTQDEFVDFFEKKITAGLFGNLSAEAKSILMGSLSENRWAEGIQSEAQWRRHASGPLSLQAQLNNRIYAVLKWRILMGESLASSVRFVDHVAKNYKRVMTANDQQRKLNIDPRARDFDWLFISFLQKERTLPIVRTCSSLF